MLKVAHHGSRTSTSQALLDAWRPEIALISAGRGNTFGHPAPEVLRRWKHRAAIYRTDLHGQITLEHATAIVWQFGTFDEQKLNHDGSRRARNHDLHTAQYRMRAAFAADREAERS